MAQEAVETRSAKKNHHHQEIPMSIAKVSIRALAAFSLALGVLSCGPSEEEIMLAELGADLSLANATIDSLTYSVESSNSTINEMRALVDSLQHVDDRLLKSVQQLNQAVKKWRTLASEQKRKNEQLTAEIERLKRDKRIDQHSIARVRAEADSLNSSLLEAHTDIRRQEGRIDRLQTELTASRDDADQLERAQTSVRLYVASENYLKDNGFLKSSRKLGRAFRKSYALVKRLDPTDPKVILVSVGDPLFVEGELSALVDRYGKLKEGRVFTKTRNKERGGVEITFVDDMLGGVDVLAIMK
jgi:predicted  nucleic acid-binding Zn-ribbon protein